MEGGVEVGIFYLHLMFACSTHSCHMNRTKSAAHNDGDVIEHMNTSEAKGKAADTQKRQCAKALQARRAGNGKPQLLQCFWPASS